MDLQIDNEIMLGLRKLEGINLEKFENKYNKKIKSIYNIDKLLKENYLVYDNGYLKINKKYIYLSNSILLMFERK